MMAMDSQALVKLGVPETLGNFRLDDHNVVEWSDSDLPGVRHKGRKETGKWINPINNADIQYQKVGTQNYVMYILQFRRKKCGPRNSNRLSGGICEFSWFYLLTEIYFRARIYSF